MKGDPSQKIVPIKTIHDGIVSLNSGDYAVVLITNSINLALKGEDEQAAILSQFQNFFNSLDFKIQILAKSRRMDISGYINSLEDRVKDIKEELLKLQTVEYIEYIKTFTSDVNIMEKQFFVVISYTPAIVSGGGVSSLFSFGKNNSNSSLDLKQMDKIEQQLNQRVSVVSSGLGRCGLKIKQLDTGEVIELYYSLFNPGDESKALTN